MVLLYSSIMGDAILVGDAGGTNVRFALARVSGESIALSEVWKRPGRDYPTFEGALSAFLAEANPKLSGASFGLAGQEEDGKVVLLNRGWTVDVAVTAARLGLPRIVVVNDFFAMARAAPELGADGLRQIAPGTSDPGGSFAVGGPGTGFGLAVLRRYSGQTVSGKGGSGWVVVGGEGGHQAYAPQTGIEWKLFEKLHAKLDYVSNEIVAAGAGFDDTRDALFDVMGLQPRKLTQSDVTEAAKQGDPFAVQFCRLRAACVMTAMGNLALASNSTGGVFIAGGVSVHLESWLQEKAALDRFYQRGVRSGLVQPIPIRLIASETAPLLGAARLWLDEQARGWL